MSRSQQRSRSESASDDAPPTSRLVVALALMLLASGGGPALGGGFGLYDMSSEATGLGGAVVARSNGPSALFYNVGGLAFLPKATPKFEAGLTVTLLSQSIFQGLPPGPAAGTNADQDELLVYRPHVYWFKAVHPKVRVAAGLNHAFGFETEWLDPDTFSGRYISCSSELTALDLSGGVAIRPVPSLGLGLGLVYRSSELLVQYRIPGFEPSAGIVTDVGNFKVDTATEDAIGWNVGLQHRIGKRFSWGIVYRSEIGVDYQGDGNLTQILTGNTQLDDLLKATLPFDQNLGFTTTLTFPAQASIGVAYGSENAFRVEVDANWTGWSSFEGLFLDFPKHPEFNRALSCAAIAGPAGCEWDDTMTYRLGLDFGTSHGTHIRLGVVVDETPQPVEDLGPFFPDGDRTTLAAGVGRDWLDVAVSWTELDQRTTQTNFESFNGTYSTDIWLVSITVKE